MTDSNSLQVGEKLTDGGVVVARTVSKYGLHCAVIECAEKYPPLEAWMKMVGQPIMHHDYGERQNGRFFIGQLRLYWKEK